ncbi:MAG: PolC-type DNA polymerase III [Gemmatimonas sp.]|uniref:3'-5' exonuclease n=1 Tax=Gemmatimonas sp. TaxID=1962908 RepID=UPI003918D95A
MSAPLPPFGAMVAPRPTTLSARAGQLLAAGPLDVVTLMCRVCQVQRLQPEAAERMALALLGGKPEFHRLPSGHWALSENGSVAATEAKSGAPRLADIAFAVVDVETTGTQAAGGDRVTEIAIVQVRGGEVAEVFSRLVNPGRPIPPYITALTQISWDMVRDQPLFADLAPMMMERLAGAVFVAHNAAFDWRFVEEELRRGTGHVLSGPRLCTVRLARKLLPDLPRRSLDHLTRYFGIEIEARHRAAGDALATARALCRMLRIAEQEGYHTWHDLQQLLAPSSVRRAVSAKDRRRRAFPLPVTEDHIA